MTWRIHRWTWRLDGPLFVGTAPAGALNRCRLFVPARTLWGALSAELARNDAPGAGDWTGNPYKKVADELQRDFRLSYLYPAEEVRRKWQAWLPRYQFGRGLAWQREDDHAGSTLIADRDFRRRLLYTRPATAIDPGSDTAAEGSLRETECVQPRWRDAAGRDKGVVALVGYVFSRTSDGGGKYGIDWLESIRFLFIGGDTRYGLGRLELVAIEPVQRENPFFGLEVDLREEFPVVRSSVVLAHTCGAQRMSGALEVLSGWDVGELIAVDAVPLWVPGSRAEEGTLRFRVDASGIWRFDQQNAPEASVTLH